MVKIQYDDQSIYVKITYTPNQIIRYFTSDTVTLDGLQEKVSKELQLSLIDNHNLGIIQVKFMQNLPKKNFFGGVIGDYYPDTTAIKGLQKLLNHNFIQYGKKNRLLIHNLNHWVKPLNLRFEFNWRNW